MAIRRRVYWANQHGCCAPLDQWLGLQQKYSQGVREMICRTGLDGSYRKAAEDLARLAQITLGYQTVRHLFQQEGQKVRQAQRSDSFRPAFTAEQCRVRSEDATCLITGADGFHVPLITDREQRKRRENVKRRRRRLRRQGHRQRPLPARPRGADQKWKEAKLVTFYDPHGQHRYTAATTGNHRVLGRLMRRGAIQLHLDKADCKYAVSDGADWIRNQYQQQLPMLDAMILDYYHLREQAIRCAQTLFGEGTEAASEWRRGLCTTIRQSGPLEALTHLGLLRKKHRGRKRQAVASLQGYIGKRLEMLTYPTFLQEGFQIGSGPTESQCKCLTARLKGRGRRWNRQGIEAHLAVSCLYHNSKQWPTYWPNATTP